MLLIPAFGLISLETMFQGRIGSGASVTLTRGDQSGAERSLIHVTLKQMGRLYVNLVKFLDAKMHGMFSRV